MTDSTIPPHIWKKAVDLAPLGVVIASTLLGGRIEWVNAEFTAITGYDRTEVPTVDDWLRIAYPDTAYREMVLSNWPQDVSPDRMRRDVVYAVTCKGGTRKDISMRASLLDADLMIVTMLDVTLQRRAASALQERETRCTAVPVKAPRSACSCAPRPRRS